MRFLSFGFSCHHYLHRAVLITSFFSTEQRWWLCARSGDFNNQQLVTEEPTTTALAAAYTAQCNITSRTTSTNWNQERFLLFCPLFRSDFAVIRKFLVLMDLDSADLVFHFGAYQCCKVQWFVHVIGPKIIDTINWTRGSSRRCGQLRFGLP